MNISCATLKVTELRQTYVGTNYCSKFLFLKTSHVNVTKN
uniref:Uncharacterized protein n=1 Tax=Anguilla anguilla TaxID=7936 RepID=A0A0E9TKN1_ANGAN